MSLLKYVAIGVLALGMLMWPVGEFLEPSEEIQNSRWFRNCLNNGEDCDEEFTWFQMIRYQIGDGMKNSAIYFAWGGIGMSLLAGFEMMRVPPTIPPAPPKAD